MSDVALIARVRSLSRLKMMTDELRMRAVTSREIGIESPEREAIADTGRGGRVLMVDDRAVIGRAHQPACWPTEHTVDVEADPERGAVPRRRGQLRPADRVARP